MILVLVFIVTVISGLIAVSGGNGLILMPSLLMLNFDIKEIILIIRISAVVFVLFNLFAMIKAKRVPDFGRQDFSITLISCITILVCIPLLARFNNTNLMLFISLILISLFLLIIFKPSGKRFSKFFIILLPIFAGICGSEVGGAGLIITILYTLLGANHIEAVQKRIIPSLIIQIVACVTLFLQNFNVNYSLMYTVIIATAIAGYLNIRIYLKLSSRNSKLLFYFSFIFSLGNLLEDIAENIMEDYHLEWMDLLKFILPR